MKTATKTISQKLDNAKVMLDLCIKIVKKKNAEKLRLKQVKQGRKHFLETIKFSANYILKTHIMKKILLFGRSSSITKLV